MTSRLDDLLTPLALALRRLDQRLAADPGPANGETTELLRAARSRIIEASALLESLDTVAERPIVATCELTRIRDIDAELAERLRLAGVHSLADIAGWRAADVARVATELGLGRRISKENWIEKAALLLARGEARGTNPSATSGTEPVATPAPLPDEPRLLSSPVCYLAEAAGGTLEPMSRPPGPSEAPERAVDAADASLATSEIRNREPTEPEDQLPVEAGSPPETPLPPTAPHRATLLERLERLASPAPATRGTPPEAAAGKAASASDPDPDVARFLERRRAAKARRSDVARRPDLTQPEAEVSIVSPRGTTDHETPTIEIVEQLEPGGPVRDGPLTGFPVDDSATRNLAFAQEASVEIVRRRPASKPRYDWLASEPSEKPEDAVSGRDSKGLKED